MAAIIGSALHGADSIESIYKHKNRYLIYSIKVRPGKPLVVIFNGVDSVPGSHRMSYYGLREELDASVLYVGDFVGTHGCYLLKVAADEAAIREAVLSLITAWQKELNIDRKDLYLAGTSKGGTSAIAFTLMLGYGNAVAGEPQILLGDFLYQPRWESIGSLAAISYAMNGRVDPSDKSSLNQLIPDIAKKHGASYQGMIDIYCGTRTMYLERHILPFCRLAEEHGFPGKVNVIEIDSGEHTGVVTPFMEHMRSVFPMRVEQEPA